MFNAKPEKDYSERINYNINNIPAAIHKADLEITAGFTFECHWHDEVELIAVVSGGVEYNVNGESVTLNAGDILFINSKQMHFYYAGYEKKDVVCDYICLQFNAKLLFTNKYVERNFVSPALESNTNYVLFSKESALNPEIYNCVSEIWNVFNNKEKSGTLVMYGLFYRIWTAVYGSMDLENAETRSFYNNDSETLKEMLGFISDNFNDKISLSDISAAGTVCQSRCCGIFKTFLNQSPIEYLTSYRLAKSSEMLQNTEMSITDIAISTGFSGTSYFSETFRKHYSCSPREFRDSHRKQSSAFYKKTE